MTHTHTQTHTVGDTLQWKDFWVNGCKCPQSNISE